MDRRNAIGTLGGLLGLSVFAPACANNMPPVVSQISVSDGRVVIPITISGKGPFPFLVDTGGSASLIDPKLARDLRLAAVGIAKARGVGGEISLTTYTARNVVFGGGVKQPAVSFLSMEGGFGPLIRGSLAAGILTAIDSDLDFAAGEWRLYPDGRGERAGYTELRRAIRGDSASGQTTASARLYGELQVDERRLDCLLDTGSPGAISIGYGTAQLMGLWDDTRPFAPVETRGLGGGGGLGRFVRADTAVFAGQRFEKPIVLLRGPSDGARRHDGIIGLSMLQGFNLSTDVRNRSLWVQARQPPKPLPERYSLSGLWMENKGGEVRVAAVGTGSPAAMSGVRVGDRVASVDLRSAIALVTGAPGKKVMLPILTDGQVKEYEFALSAFL